MFNTLNIAYREIITSIGIVGYKESDIISNNDSSHKKNFQLNCLYAYPNIESAGLDNLVYQMMFPDNNYKIPCPKFFMLNLTKQNGQHAYLYCLKFSENYQINEENNNNIEVPIVIFIKSNKEDLECFKQLLNIINYIIINDDLVENNENKININNYKKVQLLNIFYFLISLLKAPPHSLVKLKFENEINIDTIESIDFYFSSNCEIPCNKNDPDINILFLILDQTIILKVLFSMLTEKKIVFRALQAYLLHLIIPSFLKLIFPFKWIHNCITVLPKEKFDYYLENNDPFIFGVLSDSISLNDLIREYPNIIIVDIDTNEIFGDSYYEPYEPPIHKLNIGNNNNNVINNDNFGIIQGNNFITVDGSYLYKFNKGENNKKKKKLKFGEKNNIIIDSQRCQMLVDKTHIFVNNNERKWLRTNIQLIRNPEIFDLENINNKSNKYNKVSLNDNEEDIILPNRSFSYNIQNLFTIYILNKLIYRESEFMSIFKKTKLYQAYEEEKKYQNDSGRKISNNIIEFKLMKKQRNFENCFTIEYNLQNFKTQSILNIINSKIKKGDTNIEILENMKKIFQSYGKMKGEEDYNLNEIVDYTGRRSDVKKNMERITKINRLQRTKSFLLNETSTYNNYNFLFEEAPKTGDGEFKFYKKDGFLEFIKNFENFVKNEKIDIIGELYRNKIYEEILDIVKGLDSIFNQNKNVCERLTKINEIKIDDKIENKINDNNYTGRNSFLQKNTNSSIVVGDRTKSIEGELNILDSDLEQFLYSENIINFIPDFSEDKIRNFVKDNIDLRSQYYLYIATLLEKLMETKEKADDFIEKIKTKKNIKDLNIKSLIVKLYRRAYNCSGKKHLDFPYFSYYTFLKNIELEELKLLNNEFLYIEADETELYEIYENTIKEKELIIVKLEEEKKRQIEIEKKKDDDKLNKEKNEKMKDNGEIKNEKEKPKAKNSKYNIFNIFDIFEKKNVKINENDKNIKTPNQNFNYFITYYINNEPDFHTKNKNQKLIEENIIQNISEEILSILPYKKDIDSKINYEVILAVNKKLMQNKKLFELIGLLKLFSPENLNSSKQRICFWVNCFNFLIIFTIFYKKWIINSKDDWKYFFQKIVYIIGGKKYTFNDMQYILFKRPLFFTSSYKANDEFKKLRVDKADDFKILEKKYPLINNPFVVYLPTKEFIRPIILKENDIEMQMNKRIEEFFEKYIYIDENNNIILPELLTNYNSRFLYKEYKKYQQILKDNIYNIIKEKKYKKNVILNLEFKMDFDTLLE